MGKPIGCDPALLRSASESACMDCFQRNIYQDSRSRYRKTVLQQPPFPKNIWRDCSAVPAFAIPFFYRFPDKKIAKYSLKGLYFASKIFGKRVRENNLS